MMPKIVFDMEKKQPACAILQAAMGGDGGVVSRFNPESWLDSPTPNMQLFEATEEQLEAAAAAVNRRFPAKEGGE